MMTEEQRSRFAAEAAGKTIETAVWEKEGAYWVFTFTDGTELCLRLMVDL